MATTTHSSKQMTDHDEIRKWAEARGGQPAKVEGTGSGKSDPGMIRLMFPDNPQANDDKLSPISWDEWFKAFDQNNLALVYQDETAGGQKSSFNKLVSR